MIVLAAVVAIGGTCQFVPSAQASRQTGLVLDVKAFGAVGDGRSDDTDAIQSALDAGAGATVSVPKGTYLVRPLTIRTTTTLSLDPRATLLLAPGANGTVIDIDAPGAVVTGKGLIDANRAVESTSTGISAGADGVTISNVRIANTVMYGIYAANLDGLHISGVSVQKTGYVGIFAEATYGTVTNIVIEKSTVDRTSEGVAIREGGIKVHGNGDPSSVSSVQITGNTVRMPQAPVDMTAIAIETWGGIQNADVEKNKTVGGAMGISLDRTAGGLAAGNSVNSARLYGIELAGSTGSTVSANVVACNGYTLKGIVTSSAAVANTISGNTIRRCPSRGIQLNAGSDGTTVSANQIDDTGASYAIDVISSSAAIVGNVANGGRKALKAVVVDTASDVTIAQNQFSNFTQNGVLLYAATPYVIDGITVSGNRFTRTNVPIGTQLSGSAKVGNVLVSDNTVR